MIICDYTFTFPDPRNPDYSMQELDYYSHLPAVFEVIDHPHRLSLRKNLKTGEYEVFKYFQEDHILTVVFRSKHFKEALMEASKRRNRVWNMSGFDKPCDHTDPMRCHKLKRKSGIQVIVQ